MRKFRRTLSRSRTLLFLLETWIILGILYAVNHLTFWYQKGPEADWLFDPYPQAAKALLVVLACQVCLYMNELYDPRILRGRRELAIRLLQSLGSACILLSVIYAFWREVSIRQSTFFLTMPTTIVFLFFWRQFYEKILRSGAFKERVVILGNDAPVRKVLEEFAEGKGAGFDVVALVTEDPSDVAPLQEIVSFATLLDMEEFPEKAEALDPDRIVVAIRDRRGKMPFRTLLNCRFRGVQVEEAASFYETLTGKILLDRLRPSWFIFSEGFRISRFTLRVKRIVDVLMSVVLLFLASPVMLITAIAIKLDSKGPVIYRQDRVGQGWKDYTLHKFRSMVEDAEAMGAKWAEKDDPRVTRVGRMIRKYRIDELPQLFDVLHGDMSFVGPRPERRLFVEDLAREIPYYPYRLFVKPGITGWAQIKYHYGASKNETIEKLQYDLYYIKHISLFLDLSTIFDTVRVVLSGKGAR
jgi:sugar transferase (PEP-CTERM system associated)